MKRSERFRHDAIRAAWLAALILSACVAGCVWSVALVEPLPSGGVIAAVIGVTGLGYAGVRLREAARLMRLSEREAQWEAAALIRPRL